MLKAAKMTNPNMFRTVVTASGSPYCGVRLHEKTLELPKKMKLQIFFIKKIVAYQTSFLLRVGKE